MMIGYKTFTAAQLKIVQEVISLIVFGVFSLFVGKNKVELYFFGHFRYRSGLFCI